MPRPCVQSAITERCGRWCSTPPGRRCARRELADPSPARARSLLRVQRLRRLPHRPARRRRRAARPKLPLVLGHQIVGEVSAGRRRERFAPATASASRGSAGPAATAATAARGRENLCERARFTGYDLDGGYAEFAVADERFCFPLPDGYRRRRGRAAALRRPDRLPRAAARRRRRAARALRLRRRRAHRQPGRARTRAAVFAFTRRGDDGAAGVRARARRRVGRRRREAARAARRRDHLRPRRRAGPRPRCGRSPRAARSSAPAST